MRFFALILTASSLALAGCGEKEATGNTSAVDQDLSAEDFATADTTAIDAATGADANMAADVEFNALDNTVNGAGSPSIGPATSRRAPRDTATRNETEPGNEAAPEPVETPVETNET